MIEEISASSPGNTHDQVELANVSVRLGLFGGSAMSWYNAVPLMERAVAILQALQRKDPDAALFRHFLAVGQFRLATALRLSGVPGKHCPTI